jgi:hypothetical protein
VRYTSEHEQYVESLNNRFNLQGLEIHSKLRRRARISLWRMESLATLDFSLGNYIVNCTGDVVYQCVLFPITRLLIYFQNIWTSCSSLISALWSRNLCHNVFAIFPRISFIHVNHGLFKQNKIITIMTSNRYRCTFSHVKAKNPILRWCNCVIQIKYNYMI